MAQTLTKPAIEWAEPTINDAGAALDQVSCLVDKLRALLRSNVAAMQDDLIDHAPVDAWQRQRAIDLWLIFGLASEKLEEIDEVIGAIAEMSRDQPVSPVAKHTRLRRSQDWRTAVNAWKAEEASEDRSDAATDRAGEAFGAAMRRRVGTLDEFREKLELMGSAGGFFEAYAGELFLDLDALGCRAQRAVSA